MARSTPGAHTAAPRFLPRISRELESYSDTASLALNQLVPRGSFGATRKTPLSTREGDAALDLHLSTRSIIDKIISSTIYVYVGIKVSPKSEKLDWKECYSSSQHIQLADIILQRSAGEPRIQEARHNLVTVVKVRHPLLQKYHSTAKPERLVRIRVCSG